MAQSDGCIMCDTGKFSGVNSSDTSDTCIGCAAGTYHTVLGATAASSCRLCQPGSYGQGQGLSSCTPCPKGTVQPTHGASSSDACTGCLPGTYQTGIGMAYLSACVPCPEGTYQTAMGMANLSACIPCRAGTYQSLVGQGPVTGCLPCGAGKFQLTLGVSSSETCKNCAPGSYQSAEGSAHVCDLCVAGTFLTGTGFRSSSSCIACGSGTFQPVQGLNSSLGCLKCPVGTYQSGNGMGNPQDLSCLACGPGTFQTAMGATAEGSCNSCPAGTFQTGFGVGSSSGCAACGPGTFQTVTGAGSDESCVTCQPGTYQTGNAAQLQSQCLGCPAGKYLTGSGMISSSQCVDCSLGTYQSLIGSTQGDDCVVCVPGTFQPKLAAGSEADCLRCKSGTYQTGIGMVTSTACIVCGIGTYSSGQGMPASQDCLWCPSGSYQSSPGGANCAACEPGLFQTGIGQSNCTLCNPGTYQQKAGAQYEWLCTACEQGTYNTGLGGSSVAACTPCSPGSYSENAGLSTCRACDIGTYNPESKRSLCYSCMSGSFSSGIGASACVACKPGQSMDITGAAQCNSCNPGTFQFLEEASFCYLCAPGQFQPNGSTTSCNACPAGKFQNQSGQTACESCGIGTRFASTGATACNRCAPGEFQSSTGASVCVKCWKGGYHPGNAALGQGNCISCPPGFFSGSTGASVCHQCPSGSFAAGVGASACDECSPGYYQSLLSATVCTECALGTYSVSYAGTSSTASCVPCAAGNFSNASASTACLRCPKGSFSNVAGTTLCNQCSQGSFMESEGWSQSACTPCAAGTYSTVSGSTSSSQCTLCGDGYFSTLQGMKSSHGCQICPRGTLSIRNKSTCAVCGTGTFCPAGYHIPITCTHPALVCNGTHLDTGAGFLPLLRSNCSGAVRCPRGTKCEEGPNKALLPRMSNQTLFVIFEGGPERATLSCAGRFVTYGSIRLNWPYVEELIPSPTLFWLAPIECPSGTYLLDDTCTACPAGMFSAAKGALVWSTCQPCQPGSYAFMPGLSACEFCLEGTYSNKSQATRCDSCALGQYQHAANSSTCTQCPRGSFANQLATSSCTLCDAGTYQGAMGTTVCLSCGPRQFSGVGDSACSWCGADLETGEDPSCPWQSLPANRDVSMWVSVRGTDSDDCLYTGPSTIARRANQISSGYILMKPGPVRCSSTLRVTGRPSLTRTWTNTLGELRRPVTLRVIPFNDTIYTDLCRRQGFGVLFSVADQYGEMLTDLSGGARAVMSILDPSGRNVLYNMGCNVLPQDPNSNIPLGICQTLQTNVCPTMHVLVKVTLTWDNGVGILEGNTSLSVGPLGGCPPTTSWMAVVELLQPTIPYLPGNMLSVQVSAINPPAAPLVVFRFALKILGGVTFVSFDSEYSVVSELQGGILSIVGDSSQGARGNVLGTLKLRLDVAVSGVALVVQALGFHFTLANAVPYNMLVRTRGFSCRSDGYVDVLADFPRPTALITNMRRASVINWRIMQSNAQDYPAAIHVLAVTNIMHSYGPVLATCTSLDPLHLAVASCAVIRAKGGRGNATAAVQVEYQKFFTRVTVAAWVPVDSTFSIMFSPGGMTGRYRVRTSLSAFPHTLLGIDATQYIPEMIGFGVGLYSGQWRCIIPGRKFSIGAPLISSWICGQLISDVYTIPDSWFLASLSQAPAATAGVYTFPTPILSASKPSAVLLLFATSGLLLTPSSFNLSYQHSVRYTASSEPTLVIASTGASSRCTGFVANVSGHSGAGFSGLIPVFPGAPTQLLIGLSTYTVVSPEDTTMLIPSSTFIIKATLIFTDGSQLNVKSDPRLSMESTEMLVSGGAAMSREGGFEGNATLIFHFKGAPCLSTRQTVRVVSKAVQSAVLVCPSCPAFISRDDDPLSKLNPVSYPSSVQESAFLVRRFLSNGGVVDRSETVTLTGAVLAKANGRLVGRLAGKGSVSVEGVGSLELTVVERWAVSSSLLCNHVPCGSTGLKFTPPGDGASFAPFAYATTLVLSLTVGLIDGTSTQFPWLPGVSAVINQTAMANTIPPLNIPLVFGKVHVKCIFDEAWMMPQSEGNFLQVSRVSFITLQGPNVLFQVHCSGIWEEASYNTTATLTDGVVSAVFSDYTTTPPIVQHHDIKGLFHATGLGAGSVTAHFGGLGSTIHVSATVSSRFFTSVSLDFIPGEWRAPVGARLPLNPALIPTLIEEPWFPVSQLVSAIISWRSSEPQVVGFSDGFTDLVLLRDFYLPLQITATLAMCGGFGGGVVKEFSVNVMPTQTGDVDYGQEMGGMPLVEVGRIMSIPIYVYSTERLRAFMAEIDLPVPALEPLSCDSGVLPGSQCALISAGTFRLAGAFSQGQSTGRLLIGTMYARVLLNTVAELTVHLLQLVSGDAVITGPNTTPFLLRIGTGVLPIGARRVIPQLPAERRALVARSGQLYGDTDGDGAFTPLDVLFMEAYMGLTLFQPGAKNVCVTSGRCQSTTRMTNWQLLQLKPVRGPSSPLSGPDGSDLLFLLRALVGKTFFLASLQVSSLVGKIEISVGLVDFKQTWNPVNTLVNLQLVTVANQYLPFDTSSRFNSSSSVLTVACQQDPLKGLFTARSLVTGVTSQEIAVGLRVQVHALDLAVPLNASRQDRDFTFLPSAPVLLFNILGPRTLLEETREIDFLPTPNCQVLCSDASLFIDRTIGAPQWINSTSLVARVADGDVLPHFSGFPTISMGKHPDLQIINLPRIDLGGILVGTSFNVTYQCLGGIGLYRVQTILPLVEIHGGDSLLSPAPAVFLCAGVQDIQLEFKMPSEGVKTVLVTLLQAYPEQNQQNPRTTVVLGIDPVITSMEVRPQCTGGVILWSKLVPTVADEPCVITVTPVWEQTRRGSPETRVCTVYPCMLQVFGQIIRPQIVGHVPTQPRLVVQKPIISSGYHTQWRATCYLSGLSLDNQITVTERALAAGVIQSSPPNMLAVTADNIRGIRPGWATVSFAGIVRVGINVTSSHEAPSALHGFAFSSIYLETADTANSITASFITKPLPAGERAYLLLQALYSGGYTIRLEHGMDGLTVSNASRDIIVSEIDGSFLVRTDAIGGDDKPLVSVAYRGATLLVRGPIIAWQPSRVEGCCAVTLASRSSALAGYFPSSFTLSNGPFVYFTGQSTPTYLMVGSPSMHAIFDTTVFYYAHDTGVWTLTDDAPSSGTFTLTLRYTHPGSLLTVSTSILITLVSMGSLELTAFPSANLQRIHCLPTVFESFTLQILLSTSSGSRNIPLDDANISSSDQRIISVSQGGVVTGAGVGNALLTVTVRNLIKTLPVTVSDSSVVFKWIHIPQELVLHGTRNTLFPIELNVSFDSGPSTASTKGMAFLKPALTLLNPTSVIAVAQPNSIVLLGNSLASVRLEASLPACPSWESPLSVTSTILESRLEADQRVDVEIHVVTGGFSLTLFAAEPVFAFFIHLQTDSAPVECVKLKDLPPFSDCIITKSGELMLSATRFTQFPNRRSRLVTIPSNVSLIWGYIEAYNGITTIRYPVSAGVYGGGIQGSNTSVDLLVPTLPMVDTALLFRQYSSPSTTRDAFLTMLLMTNRQRYVDARVYSNEFELSAMFHVTDRFFRADPLNSKVSVLFHTDRLPEVPGAVQAEEGLWVQAKHVFDGWYVVEIRQKIPVILGLAVSFTVETSTSRTPWTWRLAATLNTGLPVPACPRSATHTASFLALYQISVGANTSNVSQDLIERVACSVQVASRRVSLRTSKNSNTITLGVALESLGRVHQANMVLMGDLFLNELRLRLANNATTIQRGDLSYINDTRDPETPCPAGFYFSLNGTYTALPPHAVAGEDCYDMSCIRGYTLSLGRCVPTPVSSDVFWICMFVIVAAVLALSSLVCCIQLALWKTGNVSVSEPVIMNPLGAEEESNSEEHSDPVFQDPDEYFRTSVMAEVILDDCSAMMMMDDDPCSPRA